MLYAPLWNYTLGLPGLIYTPGTPAASPARLTSSGRAANKTEAYTSVANLLSATAQKMFGGDWYDRFHFEFLELSLGNLLGDQVRTMWVWNAYRSAKNLTARVETGMDGITVTGPSPVTAWSPLEQRSYSFTISLSGPPTIAGSLALTFTTAGTTTIPISGSRVVPWLWMPDWGQPVLERVEWLTDVLPARKGQEQRRALRLNPRKSAEFAVVTMDDDRRRMELALFGWGARTWGLPLWWDGTDLQAVAVAGSSTLTLAADTRDFAAGKPAVLVASTTSYETVEVASALAGSVTLSRPLLSQWPIGTRVYPMRPAVIDQQVGIDRFTGNASSQRMRFLMTEPAAYASATATTYLSYPVLDQQPNWASAPSLEYSRQLDVIDALVGIRLQDDESGLPVARQRLRWTFSSRQQIDAWRKLLYALRGRQGPFWVPTYTADVKCVATIDTTAAAIDIGNVKYTELVGVVSGRRDIRIKLLNGAVYFRRITSAAALSSTVERLTISSALGVTVQPADIDLISFMTLCRMDADAQEFSWWSGEVMETQSMLKSFRDDV